MVDKMSNSSIRYSIGNESLDETLSDSLRPPSLVIIAGHPGAGKTTLALSACYRNIMLGHKCLYLTLQEPASKLVRVANLLGFNLQKLIDNRSIKIIEAPMVDTVEDVFSEIQK